MRQRVAWGALAGAVAGVAMLVCALGLAGLGQSACLAPFLALAAPALSPASVSGVRSLGPLTPGVSLHEVLAGVLGVLASLSLTHARRPVVAAVGLVGGSLGMGLADAALLAWRAPAMPLMVASPQALLYLAFGLVLALGLLGFGPRAAPLRLSLAEVTGRSRGTAPPPHAAPPAHHTLEVVVAPHCFGCARAHALAAEAGARFPALEVRVLDLDRPGVQAPPGIVAIPTYLLDGRVLFTGNPAPQALWAALAATRGQGGSAMEVRPSLQPGERRVDRAARTDRASGGATSRQGRTGS